MTSKLKVWWLIGSVLLVTILVINIRLVFKEDSKISRVYYISDFERIASKTERAYLEKEAVIAPKEEIHITADAKALSQISVRVGQVIAMNEEIAAYKTDEEAQQQRKYQTERSAYQSELSTLEGILRKLEVQTDLEEPVTTIDSEQLGESLSVTIESQISQGSPTEAIATIESRIAEVERTIEIIDEQISELTFSSVLSSPVDGVIGDIVEENGAVTFIIYPNEQNLITYLSEAEWEQVKEGAFVELDPLLIEEEIEAEETQSNEEIENSDELIEDERELLGVVVEKQNIPSSESIWFKEMEKVVKLPQPKAFEVRIDIEEPIANKPYASLTKTKIIINEALNAFKVKEESIYTRKILEEPEESYEDYIYTLDSDGKIQVTPVILEFKDQGNAIFTGTIADGTIVLNEKARKESSGTFLPMPLEIPSKEVLKALTWEDYVRYIIF